MTKTEARIARAKWRRWLKRLKVELHQLVVAREIFRGYTTMIDGNPAIRRPAEFHSWAVMNYGQSVAVRVRALVGPKKHNQSDLSLLNLLREIERNVNAVTRGSFVSYYESDAKVFGHNDFDRQAGRGAAHLTVGSVKRDISRLQQAEHRVRKFVNKRIAHRDIRNPNVPDLKFSEIDAAIDMLLAIFKKYYLLLFAVEYVVERVVWSHDWQEVFDKRWRKP